MSVKTESKLMAKHTAIYASGNFLSKIIGFAMIPIYTRHLTPADYGMLELIMLTIELISIVVSLKLASGIIRIYYQYKDENDRNLVFSTSFISIAIVSLVLLGILCFFTPVLSRLLLNGPQYSSFFVLAFAQLWFNNLGEIGFAYLRIKMKSVKFLTLQTIKLIMSLTMNIVFVVHMEMGVKGVLLSSLLSAAIIGLILLAPVLSHTKLRFSMPIFVDLAKFSLPIIPSGLGNLIVLISDRFFIRFFVSLNDTGLYSLAKRFSVVPHYFIIAPFLQVWGVRRIEVIGQKDSEETMGKLFTYFFLLVTIVSLMVAVLSKVVIQRMASAEFSGAAEIIPLLLLSTVIYSIYYHFQNGIVIEKKTKYFAIIDISNAISTLILNAIFIRYAGMWGGAITANLSALFRVMLTYILVNRFHPIYFETRRIGLILLCSLTTYGISRLITTQDLWHNILLNMLMLPVFAGILFLAGFFTKEELGALKKISVKVKSYIPLVNKTRMVNDA